MLKVFLLIACLTSLSPLWVLAVTAEAGAQLAAKGEYKRAYTIWQPLANKGDGQAQFYLGVYYEEGLAGGKHDFAQAIYWYQKAIDQGVPKAYYNLGNMFYSGRGVAVDYKEAARRFRQAAEKNYPPGQYNLGHILEQGLIANKDPKAAFQWYQRAAENGLPEAQRKLAQAYEKGDGLKLDRSKAIYWYKKLIEKKPAPLYQLSLAQLYLSGQQDKKQQQKGVHLLRQAAEQGLALAQYELGLLYGRGEILVQDYEQAVFWYSRAANQQLFEAQYLLCLSYSLGKGVAVNIVNAYAWCDTATQTAQGEEAEEAKAALLTLRESMSAAQLKKANDLVLIMQRNSFAKESHRTTSTHGNQEVDD